MSAGVEISLLGPLQVRCDGAVVAVPVGKQRALLAVLLMQAGRAVPVGQLAELLWASAPPPTAPVALRNYVMRLRHALGPVGEHLIQTRPGGYVIAPGECELDLDRFEHELAAAWRAARGGDWQSAAVHADAALSLWRGEPLSDVDLPALTARHVPRLTEMQLQARELRIEADLALARHAEAVIELPQLIAANPVRERLHALLMLALYRCGRRAEALDAYRAAHDVLAEEIGADPGPKLQALHQQVLHDDPALAVPSAPGEPTGPSGQQARTTPASQVPQQLPGAVACFTGRATELAALTGLLNGRCGADATTMVISAIGGTAGVGKTALAVYWARLVAVRFPAGQLYVNLRGYDPCQPVAAADALAGFLRSLGVTGQDIPAVEAERAALYRSLLAVRRVLVLLDNVRSVEQVRPLLPGSPSCAVIVTSRHSLGGLVTRDGAERLDLDLLPLTDAVSLLKRLIGARAESDNEAVTVLAEQCCRLPLARRLSAELAASRPGVPLAELTSELADQQKRLDLLEAGEDPMTAMRAVFSWSCQQLHGDTAHAFRMLGLHPGPDFDSHAAAALTGTTWEHACRLLSQLVRAHLIYRTRADRYGMHDLLRAYARELAMSQDGEDRQREALTCLLDHYLHGTTAAMDMLHPAEKHRRPQIAVTPGHARPLASTAEARAWLDAERTCLVAAAAHACENGWPRHSIQLAATVFRYLEVGGHYSEIVSLCACSLTAARRAGDRAAEAQARHDITVTDLVQGRFDQAVDGLRQALQLYREVGDQLGEARTLDHLGIASYLQGCYEQAAHHYKEALTLYRHGDDRLGEARALNNLGLVELRQGRYEQASGRFQQVLDRQLGDLPNEVNSLANLGIIDLRQDKYRQAATRLEQALALSQEVGNPFGECYSLASLALVDLGQGRRQQALARLHQALALTQRNGDKSGEPQVLNSLGEVLLATGQPAEARSQHATALSLASQIGDKYEQARAHDGLARCCHATDDAALARRHWQEALNLYLRLDVPEAQKVQDRLAAVDRQG